VSWCDGDEVGEDEGDDGSVAVVAPGSGSCPLPVTSQPTSIAAATSSSSHR
jgi:hypothetical protein